VRETEFYRRWYEQVVLPPENDYLVCISASSKTPVSGTGKTTAGAGIAKALDRSDGGFDAETQATLNAEEFANGVIPNAPDKGAVLMDETQGTPGEDSGMNRMRAMSQSVQDAIGSVLANRNKNLTIVVIVQRIGMLFSDLFPIIDSWMLFTKAPGQVGGPEALHHQIEVGDYPDDSGEMRTPADETVSWPAISHEDPAYRTLERMKEAAKVKAGSEDEEGMTEAEEIRHARNFKNATKSMDEFTARGVAWRKLPDKIEAMWGIELSNSGEWYRQKVKELNESHSDGEEVVAG
jgi:hypothetical protein